MENKFKGTQGDWRGVSVENDDHNYIHILSDNAQICTIERFGHGLEWLKESEANAHLIEAAPELLEALKDAYNTINSMLPSAVMGEGAKDVVRVDQRKRLKTIKKALK